MAAPAGIDWEWALRTDGALTSRQKRQMVAPLVRIVARYPGVRLRLALGRRGSTSIDLDTIRWPDSTIADAALEEARDVLSPALLEHSFRTYLFGLMLAEAHGVQVDEELAFVAAMLHDTKFDDQPAGCCFAVAGGKHAHAFCRAHGADAGRADAIGAAVAGHITVGASEDLTDPAGLLSAGAFVDLTGVGLHHTTKGWTDAVLERHPRRDFAKQFNAGWRRNAEAQPDGRARWLVRYATLPLLVRIAPYPE